MIRILYIMVGFLLCTNSAFGQNFKDLNGYTLLIEGHGIYSKSQWDTMWITDFNKKVLVLTESAYFYGTVEQLLANPQLQEKTAPGETDMVRLIGELEPNTSYFCATTCNEGTHTGGSMSKFLRISSKTKRISFVFWRTEHIPIFTSLVKKEVMQLPKFSWEKQVITEPSETQTSSAVEQEEDVSTPQPTIEPAKTKSNYHEVRSPWPKVLEVILWILGLPTAIYLVYWMLFGKPKWP